MTDIMNKFLVGRTGDSTIAFGVLLPQRMNRESALNLAAWLVAIADDDDEFEQLLKEVRGT